MLRFHDQADFVEIDVANREDPGGDVFVTVRVSSAGFAGHNDLWVLGSEFDGFCAALLRLEEKRTGEARLTSMSPEELVLTIRSVDSKGHMIVEGITGYAVQREVTRPLHRVHFGIEFDPSQLTFAKHVAWIAKREQPKDVGS